MNTSVTLAGQPSKVGGTVARAFGWLVLAGGWILAASLAGLILLLGGGTAALVTGGIIAVVASIAAYALLRGGKELKKSGDDAELATRTQAIFALANLRGGVVRAWDVAQSLQLPHADADAILTKLAKEQPDLVTVDIDDAGNILYRVTPPGAPRMAPNAPPPVRVDVPPPHVRVTPPSELEPMDAEVEAPRAARRHAP